MYWVRIMPVNGFVMGDAVDVMLVFAAQDVAGKSLVWDDRHGELIWVDIIGRRIHAFDPATLDHRLWPLQGRPTSIGLRADGGAILGMDGQLCSWG